MLQQVFAKSASEIMLDGSARELWSSDGRRGL